MFVQDLRHGFRTLRRVPGLVFVAVVTLALGIGANTAIFSVIYSVLLKPLVFPEAERLVQVWMAFPERGINQTSWSHGNFWDARDMTQAFEDLGAVEFGDVNLTGHGDPVKLDAVRVNAGFFQCSACRPSPDGCCGKATMIQAPTRTWSSSPIASGGNGSAPIPGWSACPSCSTARRIR